MAVPEAGQWLAMAIKPQAQASPPVIVSMGSVTTQARTSRTAYSPVMTTVLRRCHLVLVMDSRLSQRSSITCMIVTHS